MSDSDQKCDDCNGPLGIKGFLDRMGRIGRYALCRRCAGTFCARLVRYCKGTRNEERADPMRPRKGRR